MSDLLAINDAITAQLNTLAQDVYESAVPDDVKIKNSANGLFLPFIIVHYGDVQESARSRGIISSRFNGGTSFCVVECVAPTERASRQVAALVRNALTGFIPSTAGELRLAGGRASTMVESTAVPKRYITEVSFNFFLDTVVS